jgi:CHAT domain-containing protein
VSLAKDLDQLPETEKEVRSIAGFPKADINDLKLGVFASETTVKQTKLDDYRIVYFGTHALMAGQLDKYVKVGAEPALILTIPERPTELDDGLLTASEVAQLKLNADWVVLSACNTAAGETPGLCHACHCPQRPRPECHDRNGGDQRGPRPGRSMVLLNVQVGNSCGS